MSGEKKRSKGTKTIMQTTGLRVFPEKHVHWSICSVVSRVAAP